MVIADFTDLGMIDLIEGAIEEGQKKKKNAPNFLMIVDSSLTPLTLLTNIIPHSSQLNNNLFILSFSFPENNRNKR